MGIEISDARVISITDGHEQVARTSSSHPPHQVCLGALRVACIFPRMAGDGAAALAWAVKGLRGYSIAADSRRALLRRAIGIGARAFVPGDIDAIVPMPSSGPVVTRMCGALQRRLGCPIVPALRKLTISEAMWQAPRPSQVPERLRGCFVRQLQTMARADPAAPVQAKSISVMIRRFVPVVAVEGDTDLGRLQRALLVDDILSTGSTFYLCRPSASVRSASPRGVGARFARAGRQMMRYSAPSAFARAFTRSARRRRAAALGMR